MEVNYNHPSTENIKNMIFSFRGQQVMIDKDLGKKWFAFSKFDIEAIDLFKKIEK